MIGPIISLLLSSCTYISSSDVEKKTDKTPGAPVISMSPTYDGFEGYLSYVDDIQVHIDVESTDEDGQSVTYVYAWSRNGEPTEFSASTIPSGETTIGDVWEVTVTPNDGILDGTPTSMAITVRNFLPTIETVSLIPSDPIATDTIVCTANGVSDVETTDVALTYSWEIDGVAQSETSDTLQGLFDVGSVILCSVTPNDSMEDGEAVSSSVTVQNSKPTVVSATLSPVEIYTNTDVYAEIEVADINPEQTLHISYAWHINDSSAGGADVVVHSGEQDITDNPFSLELESSLFEKNDEISLSFTVSDGVDEITSSVDVTSNGEAIVLNSSPYGLTVSINPSTSVYNDSLLHCVASADDLDAEDTLEYLYTWTNTSTNDILLENSSSPNLQLDTNTSPLSDIECMVSVSDGMDGISASNSVPVGNRAPVVQSVTLDQNVTAQTTSLLCDIVTIDDDGDQVTASYVWKVDGFTMAETSNTLTRNFYYNENVVCEVIAHDGNDNSAMVSSSTTVQNTPPEVWFVSITPDPAYTTDTLMVNEALYDDDLEQTSDLTATYVWYVNGTRLVSETSFSLSGGNFVKGDTVQVHVTPNDGVEDGIVGIASITILNTEPSETTVNILPIAPRAGIDNLLCVPTASDDDGDTLTYSILWEVNGVQYNGGTNGVYTNDTIPATALQADDVWTCSVRANDGTVSGDAGSAITTIDPGCAFGNCDFTLSLGTVNGQEQSIDMVLVTAGTFSMGSPSTSMGSSSTEIGRNNNETLHTVTLTQDYYAMTTEFTQGMFAAVTLLPTNNTAFGVGNSYPLYGVSWHDAARMANKVTQTHNIEYGMFLQECYECTQSGTGGSWVCVTPVLPYECTGYRLLTEAEWEYAARAGDSAAIWTPNGGGNLSSTSSDTLLSGDLVSDYGWYNTTSVTSVATLLPNDFGLYDMSGNVWEHVHDKYADFFGNALIDPVINDGNTFVYRGGCFNSSVAELRSASRNNGMGTQFIGFRLGRSDNAHMATAPEIEIIRDSATGDLVCEIVTDSIEAMNNPITYTIEWEYNTNSYNGNALATTVHTNDTIVNPAEGQWDCVVTPSAVTNTGLIEGYPAHDHYLFTTCGLTNCDVNLPLGNGQSMDFVLIPSGTFMMGSPNTENGRDSTMENQHQVTLTRDFYVLTTEVTQGMFQQLMAYPAYQNNGASNTYDAGAGLDHPAYYVSWDMAAAYANAATQRHNTVYATSLQMCYTCNGTGTSVTCTEAMNPYTCTGYRLLTEAEWEYAARSGDGAAYWTPAGNGELPSLYTNNTSTLTNGFNLPQYAWYKANNGTVGNPDYGSKPVARKMSNTYGLYDMSGNVKEWVHDGYQLSLAPDTDPVIPLTPPNTEHMIRGGYWNASVSDLRSASRDFSPANARPDITGFRIGYTSRQP